jgi:hypothetical protein
MKIFLDHTGIFAHAKVEINNLKHAAQVYRQIDYAF